jgi:methionyl-tRNA synthetase
LDEADRILIEEIKNAKVKVENSLEHYKFRDGLFDVIDLARKGNKYMQEKAPWSLSKTPELQVENQKQIDNCLHLSLQLTANLAILINPFLPYTAKKMCTMMKVVERMLDWEHAGKLELLKVNYPLRAPELLFRKIEDNEVTEQVEKLNKNAKTEIKMNSNNNREPEVNIQEQHSKPSENQIVTISTIDKQSETPVAKPEITYEEFSKMDLRVGTIIKAEKVEKADKLLKLELEMGTEKRTVVSGIAMHFKPEEIVGKQVTVVANLAPRKLRGIESRGMILMAQNNDGRLIFVSPLEMADAGVEVK